MALLHKHLQLLLPHATDIYSRSATLLKESSWNGSVGEKLRGNCPWKNLNDGSVTLGHFFFSLRFELKNLLFFLYLHKLCISSLPLKERDEVSTQEWHLVHVFDRTFCVQEKHSLDNVNSAFCSPSLQNVNMSSIQNVHYCFIFISSRFLFLKVQLL